MEWQWTRVGRTIRGRCRNAGGRTRWSHAHRRSSQADPTRHTQRALGTAPWTGTCSRSIRTRRLSKGAPSARGRSLRRRRCSSAVDRGRRDPRTRHLLRPTRRRRSMPRAPAMCVCHARRRRHGRARSGGRRRGGNHGTQPRRNSTTSNRATAASARRTRRGGSQEDRSKARAKNCGEAGKGMSCRTRNLCLHHGQGRRTRGASRSGGCALHALPTHRTRRRIGAILAHAPKAVQGHDVERQEDIRRMHRQGSRASSCRIARRHRSFPVGGCVQSRADRDVPTIRRATPSVGTKCNDRHRRANVLHSGGGRVGGRRTCSASVCVQLSPTGRDHRKTTLAGARTRLPLLPLESARERALHRGQVLARVGRCVGRGRFPHGRRTNTECLPRRHREGARSRPGGHRAHSQHSSGTPGR
mmetsp:Transcript_1627/g.10018  ORF Transcript_1627/g.10018 Transcript_1627/m.10018 type:complete len:415 (+) Transcript_1627:174-1418(+)